MTDVPRVSPPAEQTGLQLAQVENLLGMIAKTLRAFGMYQANNPVFQRFKEALRAELLALWQQTESLELGVQEDGFRWGGKTMAVGKGRDSMAFAFYKDGVRYLTLLPGFEDEVPRFLSAVNRALKREDDADDLVSTLWEEDFSSLQYGYVDLLMEGVQVPEGGRSAPVPMDGPPLELDLAADEAAGETSETEEAGGAAAPTAGLSREDFDETLYFLDQSEMAALQTEVEVEMERDLRRDVLNALYDRLEEPDRPERQAEILDILDQLLPLFLSRGDMESAASVLEELDRLIGEDGKLGGPLRERVERLFERLSNPEVLEQFVQALEDGAVAPESDEVNLFFSRLHPEALPVLIRFAEMSEKASVRGRLASAIDGLAARYPAEATALLVSDEPALVTGAAHVAGRIGLSQAVPGLGAALKHPDREVRMAVVEALVAIRLTPALHALQDALTDADRDVRIAAARALGAVRFASARDRLGELLESRHVKDADVTEKMAFFEAYGAVGGNAAVDRLEELLNRKGMLGRRPPTEMRACAALGLGRAGTPAARQALERARNDEDPVVRNAVLRALKLEVPVS